MREWVKADQRLLWILKALLIAYIVTGMLLLLLALLLFKLQLTEQAVEIGIIVIYIFSTFLCGVFLGKKFKSRKYLWGLFGGLFYFLVLVLVSLLVNRENMDDAKTLITTLVICTLSGTFGGMVA